MSILKTVIQGDSLTIGFRPNTEYDQSHLQHFYVYLGTELLVSTLVGGIIRVEMSSVLTARYYGMQKLYLSIDDSSFGIRKTLIGELNFIESDGTFNDTSVNTGYSLIIGVTITLLATTTDPLLLEAVKGLSAYEIAVEYGYTGTEAQWNAAVNTAKVAAELAATNAGVSEGNALIYKNAAKVSQDAANVSETNSKTSETNAGISETNAHNHDISAGTHETNAGLSAAAALQSKNYASGYADAASADRVLAQTAKTGSETAQGLSESARDLSIAAKDLSIAAQGLSEDARDDSQAARDASIAAKNLSVTAQGLSEAARDLSITAKNDSVIAKNASVVAQGLSEAARDLSVAAKNFASGYADAALASAGVSQAQAVIATTQAGIATTKAGQVTQDKNYTSGYKDDALQAKTDAQAAEAQTLLYRNAAAAITLAPLFNINRYFPNLVHLYYGDTTEAVRRAASAITFTGTTYYVNASKADDTGNGLTPETAKKTITAAYALATNGCVLQLADGSYNMASETGGYWLVNTHSKGVLVRGNVADRTAVTITKNSAGYGARLRDCGSMRFEYITFAAYLTNSPVNIDYGATYTNNNIIFYNCKFTSTANVTYCSLDGMVIGDSIVYNLDFNGCLIEHTGRTGGGLFNFSNSSSSINVLMLNNTFNHSGSMAVEKVTGRAALYMYGNTINMSGDTKAVQVGTDGVASNTIPQFDFRENRIVYAAGCYEHALLLGGGVTTALILNNYIYMPANANSLALGIVVKTIPATLGLVKIYGNYVYAPRPIYLKGASKNDIKYNSCICNQTGYAPFEYANVLSGSSYLSSLNNIENNNLIGLEYGIILYDGGASEEENITIKTCTFKDNKFYFTTYYLKDVAINYTWANRATFWASTNEVDSVLLLESNLPIRLP